MTPSPSFLLLLLLLLSLQGQPAQAEEEDTTLELVQMLYRHGDRSPILMYPTDPHKNVSALWPAGLGQLTKRGKVMQYGLGRWLRNRYEALVGPAWVPGELNVLSTDVDRTLMSAACNLASFYYPKEPNERFEADLPWVPTPIHTVPAAYDKLLSVDEACPRVFLEEKRVQELPEVKKVIEANQDLFKFVTEKSGVTVDNVTTLSYLFDTLYIESLYNLTLPNWAKEVYDRMKEINNFSFKLMAYTQELKRLRAGPLIKEFGHNMKVRTAGSASQTKMFMYSGHDKTVASLLEGLGVFNGVAPPYIATVLVELHRVNDQHYVKMYYCNDTAMTEAPHPLILPGCSERCPLDKWLALTASVVPQNMDKECHSPSPFDLPLNALAATSAAIALGVLLLILVTYNLITRHHQKSHFAYQAVPSSSP
ncbi:prostatic acid phosphatase-like [Eriocheir sinensis]|uniref:prostatic acid phosphatase-like n=1 Tax=Eriocheir sinensis TaxID=95602 RepID=UPI0021C6D4F9|nr:prostatic acid phosphatase-like [Eriocheir sinensis]